MSVGTANILLVPFGALDRRRVFPEQFPHFGLLWDRHADGLPVHRCQSGRLVRDISLSGGELLSGDDGRVPGAV